ncbi:Hint domain-containing protein [Shimia sp. R9_3]|uniref:Hint domain-containing protein n=1 Tax=Shimia sp. R9_3 TaxID=2821113 RepID=UPI001ADA7C6B|nr:Hint domain-containing protein [Shimia sp. R9_3]MBO9402734.1 Hint domain-containing protein [Shimia sp. R9_3]
MESVGDFTVPMEHPVGSIRDKAIKALAARKQAAGIRPVLITAGCGFVQGTRVATPGGWATVESLSVGDEVLTFDAGFQRIMAMSSDLILSPEQLTPNKLRPLLVPKGTLDNRQDMIVQPHQGVLIESPTVRDKWGDPFAVIPGAALEVFAGVSRLEPADELRAYLPAFAEDQMVFVNGGALLFSQSIWGVRAGVQPRFGRAANYNLMPVFEAKALLQSGPVQAVYGNPEELRRAA